MAPVVPMTPALVAPAAATSPSSPTAVGVSAKEPLKSRSLDPLKVGGGACSEEEWVRQESARRQAEAEAEAILQAAAEEEARKAAAEEAEAEAARVAKEKAEKAAEAARKSSDVAAVLAEAEKAREAEEARVKLGPLDDSIWKS